MKMDILFAYSLLDARRIPITSVIVMADGRVTFFVSEKNTKKRSDVLKDMLAIEIDDWALDIIKDLVEDERLYSMTMMETKCMTSSDYINRFYFSDGKNQIEICGINLGKRKSPLETSYKDVEFLTDLLEEAENVLVPRGIDPRCFSLDRSW